MARSKSILASLVPNAKVRIAIPYLQERAAMQNKKIKGRGVHDGYEFVIAPCDGTVKKVGPHGALVEIPRIKETYVIRMDTYVADDAKKKLDVKTIKAAIRKNRFIVAWCSIDDTAFVRRKFDSNTDLCALVRSVDKNVPIKRYKTPRNAPDKVKNSKLAESIVKAWRQRAAKDKADITTPDPSPEPGSGDEDSDAGSDADVGDAGDAGDAGEDDPPPTKRARKAPKTPKTPPPAKRARKAPEDSDADSDDPPPAKRARHIQPFDMPPVPRGLGGMSNEQQDFLKQVIAHIYAFSEQGTNVRFTENEARLAQVEADHSNIVNKIREASNDLMHGPTRSASTYLTQNMTREDAVKCKLPEGMRDINAKNYKAISVNPRKRKRDGEKEKEEEEKDKDEAKGPARHNIPLCRRVHVTLGDNVPACRSLVFDGEKYDISSSARADFVPVCFNRLKVHDHTWRRDIVHTHRVWNNLRLCQKCADAAPFDCMRMAAVKSIQEGKEGTAFVKMCFMCVAGKSDEYSDGILKCRRCASMALNNGHDYAGDDRYAIMSALMKAYPGLDMQPNVNIKDLWPVNLGYNDTIRPDTMFRINLGGVDRILYVVMEEDTDCHVGYPVLDEATRLNKIINAVVSNNHHVLVIRYEPKKAFNWIHPRTGKVDSQEMSFEHRLIIMRAWVNWYVATLMESHSPHNVPRATVLYMFYNYDNVHFRTSRRLYGLTKEAKLSTEDTKTTATLRKELNCKFTSRVGLAYTFPQETIHEGVLDGLYALHPNEWYALDRLDKHKYSDSKILRSATIEDVFNQ
jgi:hypothetical protein